MEYSWKGKFSIGASAKYFSKIVNMDAIIKDFEEFKLNDIGRIKISSSKPLFYDSYKKNRHTGSIILIDPNTNATIAAGMII